jgi:undecaprenyl pyrophosphate phosphatase UppP
VIPGISRITGITAVGQLRRCDRRYILDIGLILCIPALIVLIVFDFIALFTAGGAAVGFLTCLLALLTAFVGGYLGITFIRFLAVKVGFSGFAYYSWGAALFAFILYLTI